MPHFNYIDLVLNSLKINTLLLNYLDESFSFDCNNNNIKLSMKYYTNKLFLENRKP